MNILVTGSSGFIGRSLCAKLVEAGHSVFGLERYKPTYGLPRPFPTVYGDVTLASSIRSIVETVEPEVVIHLAAIATSDVHAYQSYEEMLLQGIGTANVAEACRRLDKFKVFLYASSSECYGHHKFPEQFPLTEESELRPHTPYAIGKVAGELYLKYLRQAYDFPAIILRPFNTIGTMRRRTVVERIVSQMLDGGPVKLGDPTAARDFLWIDDHVSGYLACLENYEKVLGETFNFCTGISWRIEDVVEKARKIIGYDGEVLWNQTPKRPNDIPVLLGSYSKAFNVLGWEWKTSLDEGIKRMCEAWRKSAL